MIYTITQLEYKDGKPYCSPRDYAVKQHISKKKTMRVVFGDLYMDLTPKQLKKHTVIIDKLFRSKFYPDQTYRLYSYEWKPKSIKEEELKLKQRLERGY